MTNIATESSVEAFEMPALQYVPMLLITTQNKKKVRATAPHLTPRASSAT